MKYMNILSALLLTLSFFSCDDDNESVALITPNVSTSIQTINTAHEAYSQNFTVSADQEWMVYSNQDWIVCGVDGNTVSVSIAENTKYSERKGEVVVKSASTRVRIPVTQSAKPEIQLPEDAVVPEGYRTIWHDEFDDPALAMPDENLWKYEVANAGWVNNELQRYIAGKEGDDVTAEVSDGTLKIHAFRGAKGDVISARLNTKEAWTYGYFEARLKLPVGKGTWPAFWMMPQGSSNWPDCGEIDIMEEVGYNPNYVSSSIHCKSYYHAIGTQKTKETYLQGAEGEFHTYALEWTKEYICTYVDGKQLFYYNPEDYEEGRTDDTWPFNKAFHIKLNLAWGGDWGGAQGVDESFLPATYEIDYVRVFQKK